MERECCAIAEKLGFISRKLDEGRNAKGWLDRAFWGFDGEHFIVEFKLPGEKPTKYQRLYMDRLEVRGVEVHVIHSIEEFITMLNKKRTPP